MNSRLTESQSASDDSDFEGFSDDFDDTEPSLRPSTGPKPLEPPPYGEYISWKEALTAANRWAEPRGYAMTEIAQNTGYKAIQQQLGRSSLFVIVMASLISPWIPIRGRQDRDSVKTDYKIEATVIQVEKGSDV